MPAKHTLGPPTTRPRQLAARLQQHTDLTATWHEIALQHMNQIIERTDAERATGAAGTYPHRTGGLGHRRLLSVVTRATSR